MTSKIKKCASMEEAVKGLFSFENNQERLDFEAQQIHLQIMLRIKDLMDKKGWNKADFAREMGVTKAFVTNLFAAEKFINIKNLAKIEQIFDIRFDVKTRANLSSVLAEYRNQVLPIEKHPQYRSYFSQEEGKPYLPQTPQEKSREMVG